MLPLVSPLDGIADDYLLSAHMLEHVLIGDVAPALALVAVRGPLSSSCCRRRAARVARGSAPLRALLAFLLRPAVGFALWIASRPAWHIPAAYDYAAEHERGARPRARDFVVAGVLVWASSSTRPGAGAAAAGRIVYAWALFVAGHLATHVILFDASRIPALRLAAGPAARPLAGRRPALGRWVMTIEQLLAFGTLTCCSSGKIPIPDAPSAAARLDPDAAPGWSTLARSTSWRP